MNSKIKELADKVMFTSEIPYPDQDVMLERFAELIIQKCCKAINNLDAELPEETMALARAEYAIRQYFGVEQ